jgi:hypothetical protein
LLAHGRWFSPASSTTKTGRHDIAEILLKVALKTQKINQSDIFLIEFEDDITIIYTEKKVNQGRCHQSSVHVAKRGTI